MADKFLNLTELSYLWSKIKLALSDKADKTELPTEATDTDLGLVKTNSAESISLNADGQLDVGGRLGQFTGTTGVYNPKTISPNIVKDGSFLLTEATGTSLGSKSLAVSTGSYFKLKVQAPAGATQYQVANTYVNRILCAGAVDGVASVNEASASTKTVNIVSVQINGADFTPDSSANDTANNIVVTVDESLNPDSAFSAGTDIRFYADEGKNGGFSNLFVGQGVGGIGGASVIVGQRVYSKSGNACALVGADIFNQGNGNTVLGRQHISRKNRWLMAGTGHDNSSGRSEAGAVLGQWSLISNDTLFAVGNGTSHTARLNAFEVLADGIVLRSPNGTRYKIAVDDTGNLSTTAL